ncbi:MAG TPA: undecaprenyl-diphosphate phosphatase [Acidimicrobiales bacterium]|nr:undecaprenyl-diphosphate phosphatase [Acidimicrobiales bacterium]
MLTYLQAIIMGLLQGVTELFPVSSLGHSVLIPTIFGWHNLIKVQSEPESYYLAFIVGLHVGTAVGLLIFYRRQWVDIGGGLITSVRDRTIEKPNQRLAWLLIVATIPAGLMGLALEHEFRVLFSKPLSAAIFLMVNGLILLGGELVRRRQLVVRGVTVGSPKLGKSLAVSDAETTPVKTLDHLGFGEAFIIGVAQVFALIAGISRSGITMVTGLVRGLDHEDSARFSFLLATPIILAAGIFKLPDLLGTLGNGIRGQALAGAAAAGIAAYFSVRFLVKWFETRTLWPFGVYCLVVGLAFTIYYA